MAREQNLTGKCVTTAETGAFPVENFPDIDQSVGLEKTTYRYEWNLTYDFRDLNTRSRPCVAGRGRQMHALWLP